MAAFLVLLTLLSFPSFSSPLTADSISGAADVLSNAGYDSMSLTLGFASPNIIPIQSPSLTIFSPPDSAFSKSGQPSLSLLRFHFSPLSLSMHSVKSLPPGSKIPTLFPHHSIIVSDTLSLNGVKINDIVLYDDGSLVIFGIEEFLDPNFEDLGPLRSFGCPATAANESRSFENAIRVFNLRGYSVTAWLLSLQFLEMKEETRLTIFSPLDEVMKCSRAKYSDCDSIFRRHLVPCRMSKADMLNLDNGVELPTFVEGFRLKIRKFGDVLGANEVRIENPDMYSDDRVVVHGLGGSFGVEQSFSSSSAALSLKSNGTTAECYNLNLFWITNYNLNCIVNNHVHILLLLAVGLVLIW